MEQRDDFRSIRSFLPPLSSGGDGGIRWPPAMVDLLSSLSRGPLHSEITSGQRLAQAITDMRNLLSSSSLFSRDSSLGLGISLYFDELISRDQAKSWFSEVVPRLADLVLRLPELLETHYLNSAIPLFGRDMVSTGLRLLESQHPGIVFLSQELIASLLACALFCLYPTRNRGTYHLPSINFDNLFVCLYESYDANQEHKIRCIVHYFEKICSYMRSGNVSFERKVLPWEKKPSDIVYPEANFWSNSTVSLCQLEFLRQVRTSGLIEDQDADVLEVDFANQYLGGGALSRGCVQEEIRFMINPELIIGMLFMRAMDDNEAIEIVGAERFSNYTGYAASFRFSGDYTDKKSRDAFGRHKTRIIAIDALCWPGRRQYKTENLVRETNKAFCGFSDMQRNKQYQKLLLEYGFVQPEHQVVENSQKKPTSNNLSDVDPSSSIQEDEQSICKKMNGNKCEIGVATGNWGCGAFGGDPEVKAVIQWLAASQSLRPFVLYYTFDLGRLKKLDMVVQWIMSNEWTVGDLWNVLVDYSSRKLKEETSVGLFEWLVPSLYHDDPMIMDEPRNT